MSRRRNLKSSICTAQKDASLVQDLIAIYDVGTAWFKDFDQDQIVRNVYS